MKDNLFPTKSAIPDNKGEINEITKKAKAVIKLTKAELLKVIPKKAIEWEPSENNES